MTATTPEQLRQRAADHETAAEHGALLKDAEAHRETAAMLRAAADQLEAVQAQREAFLDSPMLDGMWVAGWHAAIDHVTAVLTADTAPQETGE